MTTPADHAVICKDGTGIRIEDRDGTLIVIAPAGDRHLAAAGLMAHAALPVVGPDVEIVGPHVPHVRDYLRRHGGFASGGAQALAILKSAGAREGAPPPPFHRWTRGVLAPGVCPT
ncbi:hypothetical protein [Methylorubrum extorquens]|uniref:hypothetical protein n=1 Tax=Methylorubrum extorquens TaxID=408 RepID=UPI0020A1B259|nr:hypothetical protein [Methylorubrum extorquens]MCP1539782.1 hypothetical protein [Methylorubrum extorquens]